MFSVSWKRSTNKCELNGDLVQYGHSYHAAIVSWVLRTREKCFSRRIYQQEGQPACLYKADQPGLLGWLTSHKQALRCNREQGWKQLSFTHLAYILIHIKSRITKLTSPSITKLESFNDPVICQHGGICAITGRGSHIVTYKIKLFYFK